MIWSEIKRDPLMFNKISQYLHVLDPDRSQTAWHECGLINSQNGLICQLKWSCAQLSRFLIDFGRKLAVCLSLLQQGNR